jgi:hypothetical protein
LQAEPHVQYQHSHPSSIDLGCAGVLCYTSALAPRFDEGCTVELCDPGICRAMCDRSVSQVLGLWLVTADQFFDVFEQSDQAVWTIFLCFSAPG